ncbi:hypothetical protein E2C01_021759 [Portunus trituberculatus]|uniref:Uncharacterized protein n=1 Tax=Portunus trituberculatus TaxID=210409 RepID=A0A5B7E3K6_PORTR|nr:hypothetical protein [Portunus trituberculatus]
MWCGTVEARLPPSVADSRLGRQASLHLLSPVPLSQLESLAPLLPGLSCCGRPVPARTASPRRVPTPTARRLPEPHVYPASTAALIKPAVISELPLLVSGSILAQSATCDPNTTACRTTDSVACQCLFPRPLSSPNYFISMLPNFQFNHFIHGEAARFVPSDL